MQWFGKAYGTPYEDDCPHIPTPVGMLCARCDEPIAEGDSGVTIPHVGPDGMSERPYHYECHVRGVIGGLNHLRGRCTCCGGTEPADPPELSRREAARQAVIEWASR